MAFTTLCLCGNSISEPNTSCSPCLQSQRQRHSRRSNRTPPPRYRDNSANQALNSAFASEEEQPVFFPPKLYRTPARSSSRAERTSTSDLATSPPLEPERSSMDGITSSGSGGDGSQRALTPDVSPRLDARSYSPMSAGFARLSAKDVGSLTVLSRGRPESSKEGVDLSARMFAGPA